MFEIFHDKFNTKWNIVISFKFSRFHTKYNFISQQIVAFVCLKLISEILLSKLRPKIPITSEIKSNIIIRNAGLPYLQTWATSRPTRL